MEVENKRTDRIWLGLCLLLSFLLSWAVHDKLSWAPDDGFYAYMAERMAAGDIIHKDLQVLHPGLLYFLHELLFKIFGEGFVSLRYPLIIVTMLQTALAFKIARPFGLLTAIAAASALTAFSFVLFVNATPNWYLVFFAVLIGYATDRLDLNRSRNIVLIGFLVGIAFLLRQLTGTFFALAVTGILFTKISADANEKGKTGQVILALLGVALLIYLIKSSQSVGLMFIAIYPPMFLLLAARHCNLAWPTVLEILSKLVLGAAISALPIIAYHLVTGTLWELINETFIIPFSYHGLAFISDASYMILPLYPLKELVSGDYFAVFGFINWTILLCLNLGLAIIVMRTTMTRPDQTSGLAVLAIFHSLVALILETPMYLNFTIGPVLLALLTVTALTSLRQKLAILTLILSGVAIVFGAGQPIERGRGATLLLQKVDWASRTLPGTSLYASEETVGVYDIFTQVVERCSHEEDNIYVFPSNPAIYAVTKRKSTFNFLGSYTGLIDDTDVDVSAAKIKSKNGPALIIHNSNDVYNTAKSDALFHKVKANYRLLDTLDVFVEQYKIYARIETLDNYPNCHSPVNR